jgi:hypothetical protein
VPYYRWFLLKICSDVHSHKLLTWWQKCSQELTLNPWSPFNVYTLSSTKLEIRAKQYLLGRRGWGQGGGGRGEGGSNDPIIVHI